MNIVQNANRPNNATYGANTSRLGFNGVSPWGDSSPQNSDPNYFNRGNPMGAQTGAQQNPILQNYFSQQNAENQRSRGANEGRFNAASSYLKQFATPFSPDVIQRMKSQNAMTAQGGFNNAFREQQGILSAGGQGDASSLAAASSEANRHALGATVGANNQLGIKAAEANNSAGMNVGQSILSALPQDNPTDFSGYAQLGLYDQNLQYQRQRDQTLADRPLNPRADRERPIGGRYTGSQSGVNPFSASYNPNGVPQANQFGNGMANGNSLTGQMPQQGGYNPGGTPAYGWRNFQNGMPGTF